MKILHVITSLCTGGAEHLMVDLLPRLRDLDNEVELLIFNGTRTPFYEQLEAIGIKIHSFSLEGNVYNPINIFKLIPFLREYDIIHTHNTACQLFVPIAKCMCMGGAKLVTTEHNATNRRRGKWYFKLLDKWMYSQYNQIICIAKQTKVNLENYIGKKKKITIIYNGVEISRYLKPIKNISYKDTYIISMIAAFRDQKDQDTLIKAINELPEKYSLLIVGDGARRSVLESLVRKQKLTSRVKFLGIRSDIPEILDETDIVVLSSHWEGLSLSSIEGMASGRPFVASDVDGLHEIVAGAGMLFPHENHTILATIIEDLCNNSDKYSYVASRCQERAKQYDISVMANNYNNLYRSIVSHK